METIDNKYQNISDQENRIIVCGIHDTIYFPKNWNNKYTYYLGMYHEFNTFMRGGFLEILNSSSYIDAILRPDGSLCVTNNYSGINSRKNYLFHKNDTHCYTIDENGKASTAKYFEVITKQESSIIGCCSKLEFNNFKPIIFDFHKNQIEIEETHEIISFANMGVLKINRPFDACYHIYDIISFEEFLYNYNYYTDTSVTNILNSYRTISTKYAELFQEIKKSYYKQDFSYIEVHCNSENIFRFPNYLLPLLKSSPLNCDTSSIMTNYTAHDIDQITLLKVVKIMEYMVHSPDIDFIDLLKNDADYIDLDELGRCVDYIGAYIIVEFIKNMSE